MKSSSILLILAALVLLDATKADNCQSSVRDTYTKLLELSICHCVGSFKRKNMCDWYLDPERQQVELVVQTIVSKAV